MDIQDLNSLVDDPANVPLPFRIGAIVAIFALVLFLGFKLIVVDQLASLESVEAKEVDLKRTFERKQEKASQLPAFKKQLEEMRFSFGTLVRQLPSETEIPGLILDISEKGIFHGLDIDLFQPGAESRQEFYAVKPITLKARGSYAQLAAFVSDLSGLSRIVTIDDISLSPSGEKKLAMKATIKTYRYISEGAEE
ncbi:MAG: type 4a pilus biogenesis protein PilO [Thiotrichaceae bacterium]